MRPFSMMTARVLLAGTVLVSAACGSARPFAAPGDAALGGRVETALGTYGETVFVSAAGSRVYLSGMVLNFNELQEVLDRVRAVDGVSSVMEELYLQEVGSEGGSDPAFE